MKVAGPCLWLVVAAAAILLPPTQQPLDAPVRMVDEFGRDQAVATSFAYLAQPDRSRASSPLPPSSEERSSSTSRERGAWTSASRWSFPR